MAQRKRVQRKSSQLAELRVQHAARSPQAQRLCECLREQVSTLFRNHGVILGVPLETRVKDWSSVEEKVDRKLLNLKSIDDLPDFVGLRAILLFRRDLIAADSIVREHFSVESSEDVSARLETTQFGYQSQHYVVRLLPSWTSIPSFSDLGDFKAEIQVRTVAQHIWAAASHELQYKREESVPPPLRRAIHRVSALLETVDLEFSRVLEEREAYIADEIVVGEKPARLNVDLLQGVLSELLPADNKDSSEQYDDLLAELEVFGIDSDHALRELIAENLPSALVKDREYVEEYRNDKALNLVHREKIGRGVFMSHVGLMRWVLRGRFGDERVKEVMSMFSDEEDDFSE